MVEYLGEKITTGKTQPVEGEQFAPPASGAQRPFIDSPTMH